MAPRRRAATFSSCGARSAPVRVGVLTMVFIGWLGITATAMAGVLFYENGRDALGRVAMVLGLAATVAALFAAGSVRKSQQRLPREP